MIYSKERKPVNWLERENMPKLEEHITRSLQRSGKDWRDLHEYLDGTSLNIFKKIKRHSPFGIKKKIKYMEKRFGKEGIREYLMHLKEDYETLPLFRFLWKIVERKINRKKVMYYENQTKNNRNR